MGQVGRYDGNHHFDNVRANAVEALRENKTLLLR
jgi:hypothetical protein